MNAQQAVIKTLTKIGKPVSPNEDSFGWVDWDALEHVRQECEWEIDSDAPITETSFQKFEDTFSGSNTAYAVDAPAACACGQYVGRVRFDGSIGRFLTTMLSS